MLEALWNAGELVIAGRQGFQRLYDLPERVLPDRRARGAGAGRGRGAAPAGRAGRARPRRADRGGRRRALAAARRHRPDPAARRGRDRVRRAAAARGRTTAARPCSSRPTPTSRRPRPAGAVLLSPFDNLLWDRPFAERVLGFRHLIEVYKPAPERRYGYYVLPLLSGDRIVGRADLKADRREGTLTARAWHPEGRFRSTEPLERALARLARQLGLAARAPELDSRPWTSTPAPSTPARSPTRSTGPSPCRSTRRRPTPRRRSASSSTTTRARATPPATRCRSAWPRSRAPATASPSRRAWRRRRR